MRSGGLAINLYFIFLNENQLAKFSAA